MSRTDIIFLQILPGISHAGLHHGVENTPQSIVLKGRGDSLLVSQLLVDLLVGSVRPRLHADIDPVAGRQGLLEPDSHREANDGGQRAVVDGRGELD